MTNLPIVGGAAVHQEMLCATAMTDVEIVKAVAAVVAWRSETSYEWVLDNMFVIPAERTEEHGALGPAILGLALEGVWDWPADCIEWIELVVGPGLTPSAHNGYTLMVYPS